MSVRSTCFATAAAAALIAGHASAAPVKLTSSSTGFVLSGEILEYDGESYVIQSTIGRLTVPAADMVCEGADCPGQEIAGASGVDKTFGVFGSNTIGANLMPALIEAYTFAKGAVAEVESGAEPQESMIRILGDDGVEVAAIDLQAHGSGTAFPGLLSGDAAIGMASRQIKDSEVGDFESAGIGAINREGTEHILALDGLIVIVSPNNPLSTMNIEDVGAVFAGDIENWAALGGEDAPINVYARNENSGTFDTFESLVLDPLGFALRADAQRFESNRELSDAVAADPYGIGFTGLAFERNAQALAIEMSCGLVIDPTEFNVKTEEYPLSRRLYLYTTGQPIIPDAEELLRYALSDDAQIEIADIGFVNQSIDALSLNQQGRRIAEAFIQPRDPEALRLVREFALELLDASRLSTTLRFQENSSVLDVKSAGDLERLARYVASAEFADKELVLIGFADDSNRLEANITLSEQRAAQIEAALETELSRQGVFEETEVVTLGYGPLAPVACDDDAGSATNRRVEVWVRDRL